MCFSSCSIAACTGSVHGEQSQEQALRSAESTEEVFMWSEAMSICRAELIAPDGDFLKLRATVTSLVDI